MNQSTETRVRTSKEIRAVQDGHGMPIKPKSSMPRDYHINRKTQHSQLTGNLAVYAPTSTQPKWKKQLKELKK